MTRGITIQVMIGTVTAVVMARRGTRASPLDPRTDHEDYERDQREDGGPGDERHLVGRRWWGAGLAREREPGLEPGHELGAHRSDHVGLGSLQPGGVLLGIEPRSEVLSAVEAVDDPVLTGGGVLGAEDLDAQVTGAFGWRRR